MIIPAFTALEPIGSYLNRHPDLNARLMQAGMQHPEPEMSWEHVIRQTGLDLAEMVCSLQTSSAATNTDWTDAAISELIHDIMATHHHFLHAEIPRIRFLIGDLLSAEKLQRDVLVRFNRLARELEAHMEEEERCIFADGLAMDGHSFGVTLPSQTRMDTDLRLLNGDHLHHLHECAELQKTIILNTMNESGATSSALRKAIVCMQENLTVHYYKEHDILLPALGHLAEIHNARRSQRQ